MAPNVNRSVSRSIEFCQQKQKMLSMFETCFAQQFCAIKTDCETASLWKRIDKTIKLFTRSVLCAGSVYRNCKASEQNMNFSWRDDHTLRWTSFPSVYANDCFNKKKKQNFG